MTPHRFGLSDGAQILVALVDDNRITRDTLAALLNAAPGVTVISAEPTLNVTMLNEAHPDVVLVEAGDSEAISLRAAITTRRILPDANVVITHLVPQSSEIVQYLMAGVAGFVLQDATADDLVHTVKTVASGAHVLPSTLVEPLLAKIAAEGVTTGNGNGGSPHGNGGSPNAPQLAVALTHREQEIIALVREGLANKAIADRLNISTHTVKAHVRNTMEKTGLRTRVLLAVHPGAGHAPSPNLPQGGLVVRSPLDRRQGVEGQEASDASRRNGDAKRR